MQEKSRAEELTEIRLFFQVYGTIMRRHSIFNFKKNALLPSLAQYGMRIVIIFLRNSYQNLFKKDK